jgi:uncharacterized protein (TIGR03083 family)
MKPVAPIQTVELFPPLSAELIALLRGLSDADWARPTACAGWTVKDVAAHLLGGNLGRLSTRREEFAPVDARAADYRLLFELRERLPRADAPIGGYDELLALIDRRNAAWVEAARPFSAALLVEQLALTDEYVYRLFKARPADEMAGIGVGWAGETRSPNWFDIAREYTERWLHQQHIREAAGQPILAARRWLYPVLDTFMRALPHTYRRVDAPEGTAILFQIAGDAGGEWSLRRRNGAWALYAGATEGAAATVRIDQDLAWRLFTKGISPQAARLQIEGDRALGSGILGMVSIMA